MSDFWQGKAIIQLGFDKNPLVHVQSFKKDEMISKNISVLRLLEIVLSVDCVFKNGGNEQTDQEVVTGGGWWWKLVTGGGRNN